MSDWNLVRSISMEKIARSYAADFGAGIDPFGSYSSSYGASDVTSGMSEREQTLRRRAGTAGGLLGGATIVPAGIGGLIGGVKGATKGRGLAGRAAGFGTGFVEGATAPFRAIRKGLKGQSVLKDIEKGRKGFKDLTPSELKNLQSIAKEIKLKDLSKAGKNTGKELSAKVKAELLKFQEGTGSIASMSAETQKELARLAKKPLKSGLNEGLAQLALGGAIGGVGANIQYRKGQEQGQRELLLKQAGGIMPDWNLVSRIAMNKIAEDMKFSKTELLLGSPMTLNLDPEEAEQFTDQQAKYHLAGGALGGAIGGGAAGGAGGAVLGGMLGAGIGGTAGILSKELYRARNRSARKNRKRKRRS